MTLDPLPNLRAKRIWPVLLRSAAHSMILAAVPWAFAAEPGALDSARILESVEVDYGDHSVFYNRVEAPALKPETERPVAAAPAPTAAELEQAARVDSLRYVQLWLSCTVFDGQFTEVRLQQDEAATVIYSTIDFNFLASGFDIETADSYYSLFMGIGDMTREEFGGVWPGRLLAEAAKSGQAKWQVVSKGPVSPDVLRTIGDLHKYYDAHRESLIAQRAQREAAQRAQEEWLKANPPVPEDIVVNYFPIRSVYTEQSTKGVSR